MTCDRFLLGCSLKLGVQRVAHTRPADFRCAFSALTRTVMQHRVVRYASRMALSSIDPHDRFSRESEKREKEKERERERERGTRWVYSCEYDTSYDISSSFPPIVSHARVYSFYWRCTHSLSVSLFLSRPGGSR